MRFYQRTEVVGGCTGKNRWQFRCLCIENENTEQLYDDDLLLFLDNVRLAPTCECFVPFSGITNQSLNAG